MVKSGAVMEAHCARWALDDIALSAVGATG